MPQSITCLSRGCYPKCRLEILREDQLTFTPIGIPSSGERASSVWRRLSIASLLTPFDPSLRCLCFFHGKLLVSYVDERVELLLLFDIAVGLLDKFLRGKHVGSHQSSCLLNSLRSEYSWLHPSLVILNFFVNFRDDIAASIYLWLLVRLKNSNYIQFRAYH